MKEPDLLKLAREQFAEADEADSTVRSEAQEDLRIYDGSGIWPERLRMQREGDPKGARPCLVVSDLASRVHQITNDFRQNRPGIKVRPVDDKADKDTAEVFNGIIRHIEEQSMADIAYENANFYQVVSGLGYFRIVEQVYEGKPELCIKAIADPFSVRLDPFASCPVGSDARYAFVTELIPRKDFEREYPGVELTGWEDGGDDQWVQEDAVRVAEWFRLEERSSNRITKDDGEEVSEEEFWEEAKKNGRPGTRSTRIDERTVCVWRKLVGNKILKTVELPIRWIPVFRMAGESYVLDGRRVFKGIVRDSRDSVRMVSYNFSAYTEAVALQPKAPFVGAAGQFDGMEDQWAAANSENMAYLEYNPVDVSGQQAPPPKREQPAMAAQGLIQGLVLAKDALKDTSGMGAASLGQKGNETSGKAILARQREGDVGTFHLLDNASKAIRHAGRVLVEWTPHEYDEMTVARILGEDGEADTVYIDPSQKEAARKAKQADGSIKRIYNIGVGRYDVVASVGPSFTTKRLEMVDTMNQLFQSFPQAFQVLGDIYLSSQDMPGAEKMARRLKAMLPPKAAAADDDGENQMPPEATAKLQQMEQQLNEGKQIVQQLLEENDQLKAQAESKDMEVRARIYQSDTDLKKTQIQAAAQLQGKAMDNETKAAIAGLQNVVQQMNMKMQQQQYVIDTLLSMGQQQSAEMQQEHQRTMDMRSADRTDQDMQFNQQMAMQPPAPTEGA